jgi:D-beta-D-heptose 7-phosphate kinase / D-beta-D-heptose 1-phosphate adenosyltransferase
MSARLVVVGDALLDRDLSGSVERLCPEAPVPVVDGLVERSRPGGAALAAALAARDGRPVTLVTALGRDRPGCELAELLAHDGVDVVDLGLEGGTPQKVRVLAEGRLLLRLDHEERIPGRVGALSSAARAALERADAVLVADYGRGVSAQAGVRDALATLARRTAIVWDPHPNGSQPVPGVRLAAPNAAEARRLVPDVRGEGLEPETRRTRALLTRWRARAVVLTLGSRGALLVETAGSPLIVPAEPASGGDPCGAGDRFATAAAGHLADGALVGEAVEAAVRAASAFVAAGGAGSLTFDSIPKADAEASAEAVVARTRARGGTVVATGGCFDLLHAGHVAMLDAARGLGDCLVVCLNSDESVRRLKGSDRPLVPQEDRAAVLNALAAVDAVALFDEDTPEAVLDRLRPDVWVKGGDYSLDDLPEASVVERWGGQAVILPYVAGRSTTRLIAEVQGRGAR